jgi:hypothetical protein
LILEEDTLLPQNVGNRLASEATPYPARCWIVGHSILSDGTYIELVLTGKFYLLLLYLRCTTNHRSVFLDIFFMCWLMVLRVFVLEVDVARDKVSGDAPMVDVLILWEAFFERRRDSLVSLMQLFLLIKSITSSLGTTLKCQISR